MKRSISFSVAVLYESALLLFAGLWALIFKDPVFSGFRWDLEDAAAGAGAALPLLLFFRWTLKSQLEVFARHRQLMDSLLEPLVGNWSIWQLAVISVCAGICEEAFFRGAIQGSLAGRMGSVRAVLLAAALFGAAHLITWTYALMATVMGALLGILYAATGNLLAPIVAHAVYDFVALVYFLRIYRRPP